MKKQDLQVDVKDKFAFLSRFQEEEERRTHLLY